jgi:23S rRNA pseudouridine1911/1915/1917 synthase
MTERTISMEVPALLAGVRVDRGVAMVADVSRTVAAELIAAGRVRVDEVAVTAGQRLLREGSRITVIVPEPENDRVRAEGGIDFVVVHADPELVVIDKPAGLVVHPGAGHHEGTLVGGLLARYPDIATLVDKGTSGLMVVARTEMAYTALVAQLADRTMRRRYLALVEGLVADDRGEIDAPIGRSTRTPTKMAVSSNGRSARTGYTVLERRSEPRELTLLELSLESGRTHQIRVHMAAIGHPVVGDARYGAPDRRLGSGRFFLHAGRLAFTHPGTHERVEFAAPLPEDLEGYEPA